VVSDSAGIETSASASTRCVESATTVPVNVATAPLARSTRSVREANRSSALSLTVITSDRPRSGSARSVSVASVGTPHKRNAPDASVLVSSRLLWRSTPAAELARTITSVQSAATRTPANVVVSLGSDTEPRMAPLLRADDPASALPHSDDASCVAVGTRRRRGAMPSVTINIELLDVRTESSDGVRTESVYSPGNTSGMTKRPSSVARAFMVVPTNDTIARGMGAPDTESCTPPLTASAGRLYSVSFARRNTTSCPPVESTFATRTRVARGESFTSSGMRTSHDEITTPPSGRRVNAIEPPDG
jgi:hypothetical protein